MKKKVHPLMATRRRKKRKQNKETVDDSGIEMQNDCSRNGVDSNTPSPEEGAVGLVPDNVPLKSEVETNDYTSAILTALHENREIDCEGSLWKIVSITPVESTGEHSRRMQDIDTYSITSSVGTNDISDLSFDSDDGNFVTSRQPRTCRSKSENPPIITKRVNKPAASSRSERFYEKKRKKSRNVRYNRNGSRNCQRNKNNAVNVKNDCDTPSAAVSVNGVMIFPPECINDKKLFSSLFNREYPYVKLIKRTEEMLKRFSCSHLQKQNNSGVESSGIGSKSNCDPINRNQMSENCESRIRQTSHTDSSVGYASNLSDASSVPATPNTDVDYLEERLSIIHGGSPCASSPLDATVVIGNEPNYTGMNADSRLTIIHDGCARLKSVEDESVLPSTDTGDLPKSVGSPVGRRDSSWQSPLNTYGLNDSISSVSSPEDIINTSHMTSESIVSMIFGDEVVQLSAEHHSQREPTGSSDLEGEPNVSNIPFKNGDDPCKNQPKSSFPSFNNGDKSPINKSTAPFIYPSDSCIEDSSFSLLDKVDNYKLNITQTELSPDKSSIIPENVMRVNIKSNNLSASSIVQNSLLKGEVTSETPVQAGTEKQFSHSSDNKNTLGSDESSPDNGDVQKLSTNENSESPPKSLPNYVQSNSDSALNEPSLSDKSSLIPSNDIRENAQTEANGYVQKFVEKQSINKPISNNHSSDSSQLSPSVNCSLFTSLSQKPVQVVSSDVKELSLTESFPSENSTPTVPPCSLSSNIPEKIPIKSHESNIPDNSSLQSLPKSPICHHNCSIKITGIDKLPENSSLRGSSPPFFGFTEDLFKKRQEKTAGQFSLTSYVTPESYPINPISTDEQDLPQELSTLSSQDESHHQSKAFIKKSVSSQYHSSSETHVSAAEMGGQKLHENLSANVSCDKLTHLSVDHCTSIDKSTSNQLQSPECYSSVPEKVKQLELSNISSVKTPLESNIHRENSENASIQCQPTAEICSSPPIKPEEQKQLQVDPSNHDKPSHISDDNYKKICDGTSNMVEETTKQIPENQTKARKKTSEQNFLEEPSNVSHKKEAHKPNGPVEDGALSQCPPNPENYPSTTKRTAKRKVTEELHSISSDNTPDRSKEHCNSTSESLGQNSTENHSKRDNQNEEQLLKDKPKRTSCNKQEMLKDKNAAQQSKDLCGNSSETLGQVSSESQTGGQILLRDVSGIVSSDNQELNKGVSSDKHSQQSSKHQKKSSENTPKSPCQSENRSENTSKNNLIHCFKSSGIHCTSKKTDGRELAKRVANDKHQQSIGQRKNSFESSSSSCLSLESLSSKSKRQEVCRDLSKSVFTDTSCHASRHYRKRSHVSTSSESCKYLKSDTLKTVNKRKGHQEMSKSSSTNKPSLQSKNLKEITSENNSIKSHKSLDPITAVSKETKRQEMDQALSNGVSKNKPHKLKDHRKNTFKSPVNPSSPYQKETGGNHLGTSKISDREEMSRTQSRNVSASKHHRSKAHSYDFSSRQSDPKQTAGSHPTASKITKEFDEQKETSRGVSHHKSKYQLKKGHKQSSKRLSIDKSNHGSCGAKIFQNEGTKEHKDKKNSVRCKSNFPCEASREETHHQTSLSLKSDENKSQNNTFKDMAKAEGSRKNIDIQSKELSRMNKHSDVSRCSLKSHCRSSSASSSHSSKRFKTSNNKHTSEIINTSRKDKSEPCRIVDKPSLLCSIPLDSISNKIKFMSNCKIGHNSSDPAVCGTQGTDEEVKDLENSFKTLQSKPKVIPVLLPREVENSSSVFEKSVTEGSETAEAVDREMVSRDERSDTRICKEPSVLHLSEILTDLYSPETKSEQNSNVFETIFRIEEFLSHL